MSRAVKSLLIKDMKLLISQYKIFFSVLIVWGIFMAGNFGMHFFVGYAGMMCAFVTLGTLSHDEFENGMSFLLTMPILRKDYIRGKFVLGFSLTTFAVIVMSVLSMAVGIVRGGTVSLTDYIFTIEASLLAGYLMLALEIPLQIKFGQGKGRVVTLILIGCMAAAGGILSSLNEMADVDGMGLASSVIGLRMEVLMTLAAVAFVLMMFLSYKLSCGIMEKKEY